MRRRAEGPLCGGMDERSHLQLGLSGQADGVHHSDEDGDVAQRAAHAARDADAQRIAGAFGQLHRSDVLMFCS